ncbi:MAG: hypothetical protein Athens071416_154 [Parcubacteria group bacterium Athens0714_16]|nr:MAG: hypothetical protein Athens071416_154 [Parcubacteria group bacterium Athens0714_16]
MRESNIQKMLLGTILTENLLKKGELGDIHEAEFKIFSQWGDDGIIQYLINNIDTPKTFVDIGAGRYTQPDTRFLLEHDNWSGLTIDGCSVDHLKNSGLYPCYDITTKQVFVTTENINEIIDFKEIGLLNIDIDGNDYWIWKALKINPVIVIIEYNPYFELRPITVPYNKEFVRNAAHHSSMYYGASLMSLCDLAEEKGYVFIGCNSHGGNAYFIRKDKIGKLKVVTPQEGYRATKSREHRDKNGNLTFTAPKKAVESFRGMPVFNTQKNKEELF